VTQAAASYAADLNGNPRNPERRRGSACFASAGSGEMRSAVKITERTDEKDADALYAEGESRHIEATFAGAGADFEALR